MGENGASVVSVRVGVCVTCVCVGDKMYVCPLQDRDMCVCWKKKVVEGRDEGREEGREKGREEGGSDQ